MGSSVMCSCVSLSWLMQPVTQYDLDCACAGMYSDGVKPEITLSLGMRLPDRSSMLLTVTSFPQRHQHAPRADYI